MFTHNKEVILNCIGIDPISSRLSTDPDFFLRSSRITHDLLSYESNTTGRLRIIWAGK